MLATSVYLIVFRAVHILGAVAWGGSAYLLVVYVQPSVASIAPAGAPFMRELLGRRKLIDGILLLGGITVVGGLFLYWHDWHAYGGLGDFLGSAFGLSLTIGAVAAIGALAVGGSVTKPNARRMLALGGQIAQGGGEPSAEQARELQAIQGRLKAAARTSLVLIVIAAFEMATARYW